MKGPSQGNYHIGYVLLKDTWELKKFVNWLEVHFNLVDLVYWLVHKGKKRCKKETIIRYAYAFLAYKNNKPGIKRSASKPDSQLAIALQVYYYFILRYFFAVHVSRNSLLLNAIQLQYLPIAENYRVCFLGYKLTPLQHKYIQAEISKLGNTVRFPIFSCSPTILPDEWQEMLSLLPVIQAGAPIFLIFDGSQFVHVINSEGVSVGIFNDLFSGNYNAIVQAIDNYIVNYIVNYI